MKHAPPKSKIAQSKLLSPWFTSKFILSNLHVVTYAEPGRGIILLLIFRVFVLLRINVMLLLLKLNAPISALDLRCQNSLSWEFWRSSYLLCIIILIFLICLLAFPHPRFINAILIFCLTAFLFLLVCIVLMFHHNLSLLVLFYWPGLKSYTWISWH